MNRRDVPSDLRKRLRADFRDLDARAAAHKGNLPEDTIIDWFEEVWLRYAANWSAIVLAVLLKDLLAAGRESGRFVLTIESWTERLATSRNGYGNVIVEAFLEEAVDGYHLACQEFGPLPIEDYFPIIPQGRAFAKKSAGYFRQFLAVYCTEHSRSGSGDVLAACWADLAGAFRTSPYVEEFCHFFQLPPPGHVIERHTLENPVGVGGMGIVYLAMHHDGYRVALKLLRPDCSARDRFLLEGRSTVQIRDRRFVVVKETHLQTPETPFFTMDFVEGGTSLSDLIDRPEDHAKLIECLSERLQVPNPNHRKNGGMLAALRRFNEEVLHRVGDVQMAARQKGKARHLVLAKVSWLCQRIASLLDRWSRRGGLDSARGDRFFAAIVAEIADAADCLHRPESTEHSGLGFVHGDIKPGNVLLSKRNGPLLTDLGLSRRLGLDGRTAKESFVGTPPYASPEQAGGEFLTARSDVYQLGGLLYRSLTGRAPFKAKAGETVEQTLERVRTGKLAAPHEQHSKAHLDLERICLKALQRQPENRYPTARALEEDLKRFVDRKPVRACTRFVWRNTCHYAVHSASVWIFLFLAIGLGYQSWRDYSEIPGIEAAKNKYRIRSEMTDPTKPELLADANWQNPKYTHVRVEKSSILMDLTRWHAVTGEPDKAGRIEPAFYTRVVTLQKIPDTSPREGPFEVAFQFRTSGSDVDLRCPTHPYKVRGSQKRVKFDEKEVTVREIIVDLTKEKYNTDITILIQGVIWNGFQANEKGLQWAALLSPTQMVVGELTVLFPPGGKPRTPPNGYVFDHANPKLGRQPLMLDQGNFENPPNASWWALREQYTKPDCVYGLEFEWKRPEIPLMKTTL